MPSRLRLCPTTTSRRIPATTISGPPATGPGLRTAITGCPAHGLRLLTRAHSGRPATGATGITLRVLPWLLGPVHRLLWRHQLRLWLHRIRLSGRLLGRRPLQLQPLGQQRQRHCGAQRLQPLGGRLHEQLPCEFQRRIGWSPGAGAARGAGGDASAAHCAHAGSSAE